MNTCDTCRCNKVCNHDVYGFENCDNYIPVEEITLLDINFNRIKALNVDQLADFLDRVHANGWVMGHDLDDSEHKFNKTWLLSTDTWGGLADG